MRHDVMLKNCYSITTKMKMEHELQSLFIYWPCVRISTAVKIWFPVQLWYTTHGLSVHTTHTHKTKTTIGDAKTEVKIWYTYATGPLQKNLQLSPQVCRTKLPNSNRSCLVCTVHNRNLHTWWSIHCAHIYNVHSCSLTCFNPKAKILDTKTWDTRVDVGLRWYSKVYTPSCRESP